MLIFYNALLPLFKAGAVCSVFIATMECMFKIALSHEVKEIRMTVFLMLSCIALGIICTKYHLPIPIVVITVSLLCIYALGQIDLFFAECRKRGASYDS